MRARNTVNSRGALYSTAGENTTFSVSKFRDYEGTMVMISSPHKVMILPSPPEHDESHARHAVRVSNRHDSCAPSSSRNTHQHRAALKSRYILSYPTYCSHRDHLSSCLKQGSISMEAAFFGRFPRIRRLSHEGFGK